MVEGCVGSCVEDLSGLVTRGSIADNDTGSEVVACGRKPPIANTNPCLLHAQISTFKHPRYRLHLRHIDSIEIQVGKKGNQKTTTVSQPSFL